MPRALDRGGLGVGHLWSCRCRMVRSPPVMRGRQGGLFSGLAVAPHRQVQRDGESHDDDGSGEDPDSSCPGVLCSWRHDRRRGQHLGRATSEGNGSRRGGRRRRHRRGRGQSEDRSPGSSDSQRLQHVGCRGEPIARIGGQGGSGDVAERPRKVLGRFGTGNQAPSGQRFDHDGADRVQIRLHGGRLSRPALRGEIAGCTQHDAGHGHVVGHTPGIAPDAEALCDAEVGDLRVPIVEEDVARLDVAVHDAELVGGGQCSERLRHDAHDPLPGEGSAHDFVSQRGARQSLHDQI